MTRETAIEIHTLERLAVSHPRGSDETQACEHGILAIATLDRAATWRRYVRSWRDLAEDLVLLPVACLASASPLCGTGLLYPVDVLTRRVVERAALDLVEVLERLHGHSLIGRADTAEGQG